MLEREVLHSYQFFLDSWSREPQTMLEEIHTVPNIKRTKSIEFSANSVSPAPHYQDNKKQTSSAVYGRFSEEASCSRSILLPIFWNRFCTHRRRRPTSCRMVTSSLWAPSGSVAQKSCSSPALLERRPAEFTTLPSSRS